MSGSREVEWPREMVIRVNEYDRQLMELLFIRDVFGLEPPLDVPSLAIRPSAKTSSEVQSRTSHELSEIWANLWTSSWTWILNSQEMQAISTPPQELWEVLGEQPRWSHVEGIETLEREKFDAWSFAVENFADVGGRELLEGISGKSLVVAWELGLQAIFVLPYAGEYADRVSDHCLVVSTATANSLESLGRSLLLFN